MSEQLPEQTQRLLKIFLSDGLVRTVTLKEQTTAGQVCEQLQRKSFDFDARDFRLFEVCSDSPSANSGNSIQRLTERRYKAAGR